MKIDVILEDDIVDEYIAIRLDQLADDLYNTIRGYNGNIPEYEIRKEYKTYVSLVKAANYFKVPSEHREPKKFTKKARSNRSVY